MPIAMVVCNHLHMRVEDAFSNARQRLVLLSRSLIMYYARERTALGYTEIGAAFNTTHESPYHHHHRFSNKLELKPHDARYLRELDAVFTDLDKVGALPTAEPKDLEWTVTVTLEPLAFQRLLSFHQTGMFGGTVAETTKMILSHRLYDMGEPNQ